MKYKDLEAKAEMLIRKPVAEVFKAVVNPDITTKFWFTKSSGRLEESSQVKWEWEMFGASALIDVSQIVPNELILLDWDSNGGSTTVEWTFADRHDQTTFVTIRNFGFSGSDDDIVKQALDSTGGFTIVLCGLKAYLEHGIQLNLVADKFPDGLAITA